MKIKKIRFGDVIFGRKFTALNKTLVLMKIRPVYELVLVCRTVIKPLERNAVIIKGPGEGELATVDDDFEVNTVD